MKIYGRECESRRDMEELVQQWYDGGSSFEGARVVFESFFGNLVQQLMKRCQSLVELGARNRLDGAEGRGKVLGWSRGSVD